MPNWGALFCFWKQRRATPHLQTYASHPTSPAANREILTLHPNPVPPLPYVDTSRTNPALEALPLPQPADTPKPSPALEALPPQPADAPKPSPKLEALPPLPPTDTPKPKSASEALPSLIAAERPKPSPALESLPPQDTPKTESASEALPSLKAGTERHQPSPSSRTPQAQNRTVKVPATVLNGFRLALSLLKEAVTGVGVPGLEAAVNGVVKVIEIIETVRSNDEDLKDLSDRISKVANAVLVSGNFHPTEEVSEALRLRLESFLNELEFMLWKVNITLSDRNLASRTANSQVYKDAIADVNTRMDRLIIQFSAEGIISLELNVAGARRDVREIGRTADYIRQNVDIVRTKMDGVDQKLHGVGRKVDGVDQKVIVMDQKVDGVQEAQSIQEYEALIEKIPRVPARYHDTSTKPSQPCHPGTRTDLLQGINTWIEAGSDDAPYLWLCGEVGVGKTTVAHTIAKEQETLKQLGASFFFSRYDRQRQAPHLLFPSIAYQLARFDRGVWRALAEALKPDPDIVSRGLKEQFTNLILEPLSRSGMAPSRTVIIVIDGLDECSDPASVLDALAVGIKSVGVRLRVLVSSRPYAEIQSKFKNTPLYHLATQNHFHDINPGTLSRDVEAYLTWALREIAARPANSHLPSPWPTEDQLKELIRRAAGLFIIASTYTKYIDSALEDNPVGQLKRILSRKRGIGSSPLAELDALYDQVLDDLRQSLKTPHDLDVARDIVETVILAQSEMSLTACSGLMCMEPSDVRSVLRRLTAVILLPEDEDAAITPFHASFGEYIQDDARCTIRELAVDTLSAHGRIAGRCVAIMASAAGDGIVGVEYPEPGDVPRHLSYASRSLAEHVRISSHKLAGGDGETFVQSGIWTWLNLLFVQTDQNLNRVNDHVKKAGFTSLLDVEGLRTDTTTSVGRLMTAKHVLAINRTSEIPLQLATSVMESSSAHQSKGTRLITFSRSAGTARDDVLKDSDILRVVAGARRWNMHNHPNFFIESVTVDLHSPTKIGVVVSSPHDLRKYYNLAQYLGRTASLDTMSRVRLALEVAKEVRCLHETSPLHCHGRLIPEAVLVSAERKPFFGPPEWIIPADLKYEGDRNPFNYLSGSNFRWDDTHYWSEPGDRTSILKSLRVRQTTEIWDFGCLLFEIMTTFSPLNHYGTLTGSRPTLGNKRWNESFWHGDLGAHAYQARYETAVSLLVDTFKGPEEVKAVLKGCWAIKAQDRPSIQVVVEQLELALEAIGRTAELP